MTAHKLQGRMKLWGLDISIENARGSVRRWFDPHGKETGSTKMHHHYGYIRNTEGTDGDHVDVYIGPDTTSEKVFIIDQMKKPKGSKPGDGLDWVVFDEQKIMLGFPSAEAAKSAYMKQYDDPRFFGSMKEMTMQDFKLKVLDKTNHGKKVASRHGSEEQKKRKILRSVGTASGIASIPLTALAIREAVKTPDKFPLWGVAAITAAGGSRVLSTMAEPPQKVAVSKEWIQRMLLKKSPSGIGSAAKATRARYDAAFDAAAQAAKQSPTPKRQAQLGALNEGLRLAGRVERAKAAGIGMADLGISKSQLKKGIEVEKEHTKKKDVARQIATDHLRELPDYYTRLSKTEKAARYLAELNIAKMATGKPAVEPKSLHGVLGDKTPGITALPGTSAFARATQTAEDVEAAEEEIKAAELSSRAQRISDRIDDAGLAVLAAPYAASAAGHRLSKAKNPKLRAAGLALERGMGTDSKFGKSHGREIAGLAMVAPGVTHTIAKRVDKAVPAKTASAEIEKLAMQGVLGEGIDKTAVSVKWIKDTIHKASKGRRTPLARFADSAEKHWNTMRESDRNAWSNEFRGKQLKVLSPEQFAKRDAAFSAALRVADKADMAAMKIRAKISSAEIEKLAMQLYPDWEYMTVAEQEKIANYLARLGGSIARGVGSAVQGVKNTAQGAKMIGRDFVEEGSRAVKGFVHNVGDMRAGAAAARKAHFRAGAAGQPVAVGNAAAARAREKAMRNRAIARGEVTEGRVGAQLAQRDAVRAQRAAQNAPVAQPSLGERLKAYKAQKSQAAQAATTQDSGIVPTPAGAGATAGATGTPAAAGKPLITAGRIGKAGLIGAGALGLYGGYKGIQTVSNMLSNHHETPLAPTPYTGVGRTF